VLKRLATPKLVNYNRVDTRINPGVLIHDRIKSGEPFMISRFGSEELKSLKEYKLRNRNVLSRSYSYYKGWINNIDQFGSEKVFDKSFKWKSFDADWQLYYSEFFKSMSEIDVLGSWLYWERLFSPQLINAVNVRLSRLEPYYHETNWLKALEGKKVLVIHPMKESILKQYEIKDQLFDADKCMPDFQLEVLKAKYFDDTSLNTWELMFNYYLENIEKFKFDVAIIGNGSWGMPLASKIKKMGKQAIHLGGAVQLLFGIMGNRWYSDYPFIRGLMNQHWIFPNQNETPVWSEKYDNKAYW